MDKIYKPGECMKHMNVEMHPTLLQAWYCADVSRELSAAGAKLLPAPDICDPALVMWSRQLPSNALQLDNREPSDRALYIVTAEDLADHVTARSLSQHVSQLQDMVGRTITLVVFGVKEYFKSARKRNRGMTDIDLEMAKTDLLVSVSVDTAVVNSPNNLALLIVQFTKAIAEAPHKMAKRAVDEQAEFYMRGDNKKCVALDKDGNGVSRLWQQMVSTLPNSSLETARALCAQYESPRAFYIACQQPNSVNEIADICVSRTAIPGSKTRRIGPEFARKLHTLFTAEDGNTLID